MLATRSGLLLLLLSAGCAASRTPGLQDSRKREAPPARGALITGMIGLSELEVTGDLDPALGDVDEVDDESIPMIGALVQQPLAGRRLRLGLEGGFTLGWENDVQAVVVDSGSVLVAAENDFLLVDLFVGAFADLSLGERLRLYAGAGPLLQWASIDVEWNDTLAGDVSVDESGFGGGYYARTGFEFALGSGLSLGLGVRYLDSSVDPGGDIDDVEFEEFQYVLTATRGM